MQGKSLKAKNIATTIAVIALVAVVAGAFSAQLYERTQFKYDYQYRHEVTVSSLAALDAVTINPYTILAVPPTLNLATTPSTQTYLNNTTRSEIFSFIGQNPGAGFRAIAAALCLPLGLAEYHLGILVKSGLVSYVRDGRYKRFFIAKRYSKGEMQTISLLRHRTTKRIIETLLHKKELSHSRLANEVAITSQALTWQMKTLRNTRFVLEVNDGIKTVYSLDQSTAPVLVKYLSEVE
jgi:DNA-binding transcriptional ArsR family regulator